VLEDEGVCVRFSEGEKYFSLLHKVLTGSGAHAASYPVSTGDFVNGANLQDREINNSLPISSEIRNV
jgi:hypothetical protein